MSYQNGLKRNITLYYIAEFLAELVFLMPIFIAFQKQYISFSQMSLLAASRYAITLLLELPTGAFADLAGRKLSTALGLVLQSVGLILIAVTPGAQSIIIGTLIRAVGESFMSGSSTALIYDTLKELGRSHDFSKVMSTQTFVTQWAIIIGTVSGGYLYAFNHSLPYLLWGITNAVSAVLYLCIQEPHIDSEKFTFTSYINQARLGFKELLKSSYSRNLTAYYSLVGGISWSWQVYFNLIYVASIGYSEITQGWILSFVRMINSLVIVRLLSLNHLITKKRVFFFFPTVMIAAVVMLALPVPVLPLLAIFGMTIPSTLRFVLLDRYTNEVLESKYRAAALSSLNMLVGIVYVLFVVASGPLLDHYPVQLIFFISGALTLFLVVPQAIRLTQRINQS